MTRSGVSKIIILVLIAAFAVALLFLSVPSSERFGANIKFADEDSLSNTIELSSDGWEKFTYRNAPAFSETVFDGEDAYYYELDCDKTEQYSMEASLTSPVLGLYDREYELGLRYFTRQKESVPNELAVFVSDDGENFTESDRAKFFDSGAETAAWRNASLKVKGGKYIKFVIKVHYSGAGVDKIENAGLYLCKKFTLTATASGTLMAKDFSVILGDGQDELLYDGQARYPVFDVVSDTETPYFYRYAALNEDGEEVSPISAGAYTLRVDIYNDANAKITSFDKPYVILPQSIKLESYSVVANNEYVVLLDAEFVDGAGRKIDLTEAGCDRIYPFADRITVEVKNSDFQPYSAEIVIGGANSEAGYLYFLKNKDIVCVYDGEEKSVLDETTVFSEYDYETGVFTELSAALGVSYMRNGEVMEGRPISAGAYEYVIEYGNSTFNGTLTILPKVISEAEYVGALDKTYDGTTAIAENGEIKRKLSNLNPIGIIDGDEVYFDCEKTLYARETGKTYPIAYGAFLTGADAGNYVAAEEVYVAAEARITPAALYWTNNSDVSGGSVRVSDKEYDGTVSATIANASSVALVMKGLGSGKVTYGDIRAKFESKDAGERKAVFTLVNEALYDKYQKEITTDRAATAFISAKKLVATAAVAEDGEKTYDGNVSSSVRIVSVELESGYDVIGDGFKEAFETGEYAVGYETAEYDLALSGNRQITVRNAFFKGFTRETEKIFGNYSIETIVINGRINPAEIEVITEKIRIYNREALPDIETTALDPEIITARVYATYEDAENELNPLPDTTQIEENGDYFLRVKCISNNFTLVGNVILPLAITPAQDKERQFISTAFKADGKNVVVPVGGRVSVAAASVTEDGRKTGLSVSYSLAGTSAQEIASGVYEILREGAFTVTVSCYGNAHYLPAEDVAVTFEAADFDVSVSSSLSDLYAGERIPTDELNATAEFYVNGTRDNGKLRPIEETGVLKAGSNVYGFFYEAADKYMPFEIDFTIEKEVYERTAEGYVLTNDAEYVDGKTYYVLQAEKFDAEEGESVSGEYYEKTETGYALTADEVFAADKEYYVLAVEEDETRTVKTEGYYVYDGAEYVPVAIGETFVASETYFRIGREFYGEKPIEIELAAERRAVTVALGGTATSVYGERIDPFAAVEEISIEGMGIPIENLGDFKGGIRIVRIGADGEEDVTESVFEPGEYAVYGTGAPEGGYEFRVGDDGGFTYELAFEGTATLKIEKSRITVCAPNLDKYYFVSPKTEEEIRAAISIEGTVLEEDVSSIIAGTTVVSSASRIAAVGNYAIVLSGEKETEHYVIDYRSAYVTVLPAEVTIFAVGSGHVYGNQPSEIRTGVSLTSGSAAYSAEDIAALKEEIAAYIRYDLSVSAESDAGDYPINVYYAGDVSNIILTVGDSVYTVSPASLTGITFEDMKVLYDGERHFPEISYDKEKWQGLTVRYDKGFFVDAGVYEYTAVVSKKNYKDLTLTATLTIGTLTVTSSSLVTDAVTISVSKEECEFGLSPETYAILTALDTENKDKLAERIDALTEDGKKTNVLAAYDINVFSGVGQVALGYSSYELTLRPSAVKHSAGLKIYGYGDGGYGEIEYEYKNGTYYLSCASLEDIAFVTEVKETVSPIFIWIGVAIFALLVLFVLAVVFSGSKKGRKERARSRRRHHRWA